MNMNVRWGSRVGGVYTCIDSSSRMFRGEGEDDLCPLHWFLMEWLSIAFALMQYTSCLDMHICDLFIQIEPEVRQLAVYKTRF